MNDAAGDDRSGARACTRLPSRVALVLWAAGFAGLTQCGLSSEDSASDLAGPHGLPTGNDTEEPEPVDPGETPELESSFLAPSVTGAFVWSANPESGRVARIDAGTLEIAMTTVGPSPRHLIAIPGAEGDPHSALVINDGSQTASRLTVEGESIVVSELELHEAANAWTVAPSGRIAIAWTDFRQIPDAEVTDGFQDVTVLDLENDASTRLSVGYRPVKVHIDNANERAYVVAEPGISVLDLSGPTPVVSDFVELSGFAATLADDVGFSRDSRTALLRKANEPAVYFVNLESHEEGRHEASGPVTDLDVSEAGDIVAAVVLAPDREPLLPASDAGFDGSSPGSTDAATTPHEDPPKSGSDLLLFSTDDGAVELEKVLRIEGETLASVSLSKDGSMAVLYRSGSPRITLVEIESSAQRSLDLKSPVTAVTLSDDGAHAIAVQSPPEGASTETRGAFSVIPTRVRRSPKIVGTEAPVVSIAYLPEAPRDRALVTVSDGAFRFGTYWVALPDLGTQLLRLASEPIATGMVPSVNKGFVAQIHPEGRISFIELTSRKQETLTGFELAAKVVQ